MNDWQKVLSRKPPGAVHCDEGHRAFGCCYAGLIMDFSKPMTRIWDFNREEKTVWVEPGVVEYDHGLA